MSKLIEVAYVVEDMDAAIDRWLNDLDVGPWFTGIFDVPEMNYRGNVFASRIKVGFAMSNSIMIELMQQLDGHPSTFSELGPGFNHLMFQVADRDAEIARYAQRGCEVAMSGRVGEGGFAMIDARAATGGYIEVATYGGFLKDMYEMLEGACRSWDGLTEPRRDLFAALGF